MTTPAQITVVTSWSEEGGKLYGDEWFDSFTTFWRPLGMSFRVREERHLLADPEVAAFRAREADEKTTSGHYRWGALKWSWKVFALTMPPMPTSGWMVWIDGDVEFTKTPTQEFFDTVCPDWADVSFLARPWAYASETGFVAYNMSSPSTRAVLGAMRDTYLSGDFRALDNWGDAAVFDFARSALADRCGSLPALRENNLAAGCDSADGLHVWPLTVLGEFMEHRKGPKRKKEAYGGAV